MAQSKHKQITFEKIATNGHFPMVLHVDFGKHILTPKVPSQENYFTSIIKSRQFGLYNAGEHKYYVFVWPENVARKEDDEVCSYLYYTIFQNKRMRLCGVAPPTNNFRKT